MEKSQMSLVQRSLFLRAKYRVNDRTVRVAPSHIGFHPANRNGQPPSADRCVTLLGDILGQGFDPSEADCNGVLVQEKPGTTTVHDYNVRSCDGNDRLSPSVEGLAVTYGSLSHSHLNQVFKNILARIQVPGTKISNSQGRLDIGLLEEVDNVFARYCKDGLLWDVLSHRINDEEPEGLNIIQAACNSKNAIALIPHEMEAIASLSRLCKGSLAVAGKMNFQQAKEQLSLTLPGMAEDPDFIHMFRFVLDLGGDASCFIPDLMEFTGKFLNPQARRLRFACFTVFADMPLTNPHLKIAFMKWSYRQSPKFGFCPIPDAAKIKSLTPEDLQDVENVLRYFHMETKDYLNSLTSFHRAQFLGNVDSTVVDALLSCSKSASNDDRRAALQSHVKGLLLRLKSSWPDMTTTTLPLFCEFSDKEGDTPSQTEHKDVPLLPKVIKYDEAGVPINAQDSIQTAGEGAFEVVEWKNWVGLEEVKRGLEKDMAKAAVVTACLGLYLKETPEFPFLIHRSKGKLQIVASQDLSPGALLIPLIVTGVNNLTEKPNHPHAVEVKHSVTDVNGATSNLSFFAVPEFSLPKTPPEGKGLEWSTKHAVFFFWGFRRDHAEEVWNCEATSFVTNVVHVAGFSHVQGIRAEPKSLTAELTLPIITNTRSIKKNEEVVLKWARPIQKAKVTKARTWQSDVNVSSKKTKVI